MQWLSKQILLYLAYRRTGYEHWCYNIPTVACLTQTNYLFRKNYYFVRAVQQCGTRFWHERAVQQWGKMVRYNIAVQ